MYCFFFQDQSKLAKKSSTLPKKKSKLPMLTPNGLSKLESYVQKRNVEEKRKALIECKMANVAPGNRAILRFKLEQELEDEEEELREQEEIRKKQLEIQQIQLDNCVKHKNDADEIPQELIERLGIDEKGIPLNMSEAFKAQLGEKILRDVALGKAKFSLADYYDLLEFEDGLIAKNKQEEELRRKDPIYAAEAIKQDFLKATHGKRLEIIQEELDQANEFVCHPSPKRYMSEPLHGDNDNTGDEYAFHKKRIMKRTPTLRLECKKPLANSRLVKARLDEYLGVNDNMDVDEESEEEEEDFKAVNFENLAEEDGLELEEANPVRTKRRKRKVFDGPICSIINLIHSNDTNFG
eukprot:TRINITY_DN2101_c0_g1_i1.p1 TRINITY_DN2101_c0_g1~~TRINITY_DN2101_c0_g1_i1.p1  ORF type:complete len:352 (-),score=134.92 TRINITY_DN2101_c0_g1_i1:3-1058(-)